MSELNNKKPIYVLIKAKYLELFDDDATLELSNEQKGWCDIIEWVLMSMRLFDSNNRITLIKEKYGSIRFSFCKETTVDMSNIVNKARAKSEETCQCCGAKSDVHACVVIDYQYTLCHSCFCTRKKQLKISNTINSWKTKYSKLLHNNTVISLKDRTDMIKIIEWLFDQIIEKRLQIFFDKIAITRSSNLSILYAHVSGLAKEKVEGISKLITQTVKMSEIVLNT